LKAVVFVEIDITLTDGDDTAVVVTAFETAARRDLAGFTGPGYRVARTERGALPRPIIIGMPAEAILSVVEPFTPAFAAHRYFDALSDDEASDLNVSVAALAEIVRIAGGRP
jgi:hypothetical protein